MMSKQITKIFYLIAEGYNYNAKLSKLLKRSKATLNSQLNELKKLQLIKWVKKPGNITEYDLNFDKLAELIIELIDEADQRYQKKFKKLPSLNIKEAEKAIKAALKENFIQLLLKEHFSVCSKQDVELKNALSMFLRAIGSFTKEEIKKIKTDKIKSFQVLYKYARDFYLKELVFNPIFILRQRIMRGS